MSVVRMLWTPPPQKGFPTQISKLWCDLQQRSQDHIHAIALEAKLWRRARTATRRETTMEMFFLNHRILLLNGVNRKRSLRGGEP
jgi:hypothetical protein